MAKKAGTTAAGGTAERGAPVGSRRDGLNRGLALSLTDYHAPSLEVVRRTRWPWPSPRTAVGRAVSSSAWTRATSSSSAMPSCARRAPPSAPRRTSRSGPNTTLITDEGRAPNSTTAASTSAESAVTRSAARNVRSVQRRWSSPFVESEYVRAPGRERGRPGSAAHGRIAVVLDVVPVRHMRLQASNPGPGSHEPPREAKLPGHAVTAEPKKPDSSYWLLRLGVRCQPDAMSGSREPARPPGNVGRRRVAEEEEPQ